MSQLKGILISIFRIKLLRHDSLDIYAHAFFLFWWYQPLVALESIMIEIEKSQFLEEKMLKNTSINFDILE